MRHLRPYLALLAIAAMTAACSAAPGSNSSGENQPSTGNQPSQAAASSGGGGGGGGGRANGSVTYNFANQSGEGAVILINTQAAEGTEGQSFTYGDGSIVLTAVSTPDSGMDCTFNLTKNDSSGLTGDMDCNSAIAADTTTGAQKHVKVTAHWDAHP